MRKETLITVLAAAAALVGAWASGEVDGLAAILEVAGERVLDGDARGALEALGAI